MGRSPALHMMIEAFGETRNKGCGMSSSQKPEIGIELRPDGWERFRQAVHAAAKSGPKRKVAQNKETRERATPKDRKNVRPPPDRA